MSQSRRPSWQQALLRSWRGARTIRKASARWRPALETLEDRAVPTVNFGTPIAYSAGGSPVVVMTADLNGDGKLDLVTVNPSSNSVSVMLGNGNGTFQAPHTYPTGRHPVAVTVAHVLLLGFPNGQPIPDLVTVNSQDNSISVLLNNGDGTFQAPTNYLVGSAPQAIAVGDFNGDGKPDIVTANHGSSTVSVLLGGAAGTFQAATSYATGSAPDSVVVGDFNGDGKLDIATANATSNNVSVLLGNGNGTFQPPVNYAGGGNNPSWITAAALVPGGPLDLVTANFGSNNVGVLLGNGNGTFQAPVNYTTGTSPTYVSVVDLNNDGKLDLIVADNAASTASVLLGNGNGTFQSRLDFSTGQQPVTVAAGDFNGDGKLDLASAGGTTANVLLNTSVLSIGSNQTAVTGTEGSLVTAAGPFDDPFGPAAVALTASIGTVVKNSTNTGWTWSYTPPVGPASATVTITARDTHGQTASTSFSLTVNNVPPTITQISVPTTGAAGSAVLLSGAATDPGRVNDPLTYTWTVSRPDGTTLTLNGANASFTPSSLGVYQVTLSVIDSGAATTIVAVPRSVMVTPGVTLNTDFLPINAAQMTINGAGFDPTAAHNTVTFNDGAVGSVTAASATSLTVTFSTKPTRVGSLTAIVSADGSSSTAVQVATVTPVVTFNTSVQAFNTRLITISGLGFDPTAVNNAVTFNDGAVGSVALATATSLTVAISTLPTTIGSLTAIVSTDGVSSGAAVQVAQTVPVLGTSVVEGPTAGTDSVVLGDPGAWTATSSSSFLHVTAASASGTGNAVVEYSFDANTGATRTGTLTIAGLTLTVTQAGSSYVAANPLTTIVAPFESPVSGFSATGMAADGAGNVYFTDLGAGLLKEWNTTTQQVRVLASFNSSLSGVAVDRSGNLFITGDMVTLGVPVVGVLYEWNATTQQVSTLLTDNGVGGVAVDAADNVYFTGGGRVDVYNVTTKQVSNLIPFSDGFGPAGVAVDAAGNVYFTDSINNAAYEYKATTGQISPVVSGLNIALGVAVDGSGNVYIADTLHNEVKEWNATTQQVSTILGSGLNAPGGVAVDVAGNVYIADTGNNAIKTLTKALVPSAAASVGAAAGSTPLSLPVLPTSQSLTGVFTPSSSDTFWLTPGASANGVVNFSVTALPTGTRTAQITVLGQPINITQTAPPGPPALGTSSVVEGPTAGADSVVLADAFAWTATSNSPFLHVTTGSTSGTGNAVVQYSFDANTGATRSGTFTIAGLTLTVTQAGSTYVAANPLTSLVSGGLTTPEGVAVDAAGNVYFSDTLNNAIEEWNAATQQVTTLVATGLAFPQGVAVDAAGNVYIADTNDSAIKEWNATTQQVTTLVATGLNRPDGVAVDKSGNVYIADTNHSAIEEWKPTTQQLTTLVSSGLDLPAGVAVDKSGNVYIANPPLNSVVEWNATTQQVTTLVATGLSFPHGVAVDAAGNVTIADTFNNAIKEWNATTQQVTTLVSGLNRPQGVAVDAAGNVYVADTKNFTIKKWKPTTQQLSTLVSPGVNLPVGVAWDKSGNVYVANTSHNAIEEWKAATQQFSPLVTGLNAPHGVAVDAAGNVYFTDSGNNALDEWNATTQQVSALASGLSSPYGVAVDAVGDVYFADSGNNAIREWKPTTLQVTTLISGLNGPAGVAVDAAGNIYIADSGNNAIKEWNVTTRQVTILTSGLNGPAGVAVDAAGNVTIADTGNNAIKEWNASTQQVSTLSSGLNAPAGVAVDGSGNRYIADTANNAIKTLTKALVPGAAVSVGPAPGSTSLLPVLPSSELLTGLFAPSSDQPWLTVGASANGIVNFSFAMNIGPARTAHLTVLGQPITIQQASGLPTITQFSVPATDAEGSPVTVNATATLPAGVTATLTYTWTIAAPAGAGSNLTLTGTTVSFTPPDDGNFGVSLTVSDAGGSVSRLAPAGLQQWYRGEGNGLNSQGHGFRGTPVGGVTYAAGEVGQAFSFDGLTGYVQLPGNFLPYPTSGTGTTPLSFETWFRTSSGGVILGQQASAPFGPISGGWIPAVYVGTDGHLYAQMFWNGGAETPIVSSGTVNDNTFHHVAVTYDGTTETVYLDGIAIGTQALTQVAYATIYNYQLGLGITTFWPAGNGGWFPFKGLIDEASFYNRALSAAEVQSVVADGSAGKSMIAVANVAPTPTLTAFTTDLATQVVSFTLSATDPSTTDVAGFGYTVNWGDGAPNPIFLATPGNGSGVHINHIFTNAGTYNVSLTASDEDGGATTITRTITILPVTSANLQTVISQQGSITLQETSDPLAQTLVSAVNGLAAQTTPVTITMNLAGANYTDLTPSPKADITLVIMGSSTTTIVGHSPALDVAGGSVIIENLTLITDTDSPTVKISGGNLKLHDVHIEGNGAGSQPAIDITGGNVDLGTAKDPGGNTFNGHGNGGLIHNTGPNGVDAVGDMFETDGTPLTSPFRIKDKIFDALNAGGGGPVTYVPGNLYISVSGGDIQRGIDAIATGGTVNVEAGGSYQSYVTGSKLVTVAFQNGPVLTQEQDSLAPSQRTLVVTGTPGNDKILFNPGVGTNGTVKVLVNNLPQGIFSPTGRLIAYGMGGDDDIEVAAGITLPAWLYGGAGNDRLKGGGGNNVLVGGAGDNELIGGPGHDLLIGGSGASTLVAGSGDDLLIAGTTAFDANEAALSAIMAEWTSGRSYATRIANLSGTGNGPRANGNDFLIASGSSATVFDNGGADVLHGGSGMDWFFANLAQDLLHGRHGWQIVENL